MAAEQGEDEILRFADLECKITTRDYLCRAKTKTIFQHVSGTVRRGQFVAILGPSGSGKTTFMDALAGRLSKKIRMNGTVHYFRSGGKPVKALPKGQLAVVKQNDIMMPTATVTESLLYSAMLRLPRTMSYFKKKKRVREIIAMLGLESCKNTKIGDEKIRGVSGGERKRAAIGVELITDPTLVFLDEPTSGLDAAMALSVVKTLLSLTKSQRTVIATLHQPRSNIYNMLDYVMVLAPGGVVYYGPPRDAMNYFAGLEPSIFTRDNVNPADYLLDILCDEEGYVSREKYEPLIAEYDQNKDQMSLIVSRGEEKERARVLREHGERSEESNAVKSEAQAVKKSSGFNFLRKKKTVEAPPIASPAGVPDVIGMEEGAKVNTKGALAEQDGDQPAPRAPPHDDRPIKKHALFHTQFNVLFIRAFRNSYRNPLVLVSEAIQYLVFAFLVGLMYLNAGTNQVGVRDRQSALFFSVVNLAFLPSFAIISVFPKERALFNRERASGAYGAFAFFLAYVMVDAPRQHMFGILFSSIVYYMIGLNDDFYRFLIFIAIMSLTLHASSSFSLCTSTLVASTDLGILVLSFVLLAWMSFGGFFITDGSTPWYFLPFLYTSFIRYGFRAACLNEFEGVTGYTCDADEICAYSTGEDVLKTLTFEDAVLWQDIVIIISMIFVFRTISYLALRFVTIGDKYCPICFVFFFVWMCIESNILDWT